MLETLNPDVTLTVQVIQETNGPSDAENVPEKTTVEATEAIQTDIVDETTTVASTFDPTPFGDNAQDIETLIEETATLRGYSSDCC